MIIALGAALLTAALLGLVAHLLDSEHQFMLVAAALARVLMGAAFPGTVLLAVGAGWFGIALGSLVIAAVVWTQFPLFRSRFRRRAGGGTRFGVLHANIMLGKADPGAIVAAVDRYESDVVTVVELTPSAHQGLVAAGIEERLPYTFISASSGGNGTAIYSRHPITDETRHHGYITELLSARVQLPGGPCPLVFAVHPVPPWPRDPSAWVRELAALRQLMDKIPLDDGPVVVSGDFNATFDHKRYRDMLSDRYRDAAIEVGAGHLATYSADTWYPPLIAIDHIVVSDAAVMDVGVVDLPGSDHRGIRADLRLLAS